VIDEASVEDLVDAGHTRAPRTDDLVSDHAKNVQDTWSDRPDDEGVEEPPVVPKIAVVVRLDLEAWQKLNVTAFTASGVAARGIDLVGEPYEDGSGQSYLPMLGYPVMVFGGDGAALTRAFHRALDRGLTVAVYTDDLFATGNDVDNRAAVRAVATDDLVLAGFAVAGPARTVDKVVDKLRLHP
jgi:hypothetical protein